MKRLRLRGDWSDTGPNARPDSGAAQAQPGSGSENMYVKFLVQNFTTR